MSAFVNFICQRFSLAIVAVGGVVMLLAFLSVEANSAHLGKFGVVFRGNTDTVDVQIPQGALQSGDQIDLPSLTPQQRFEINSGAAAGTEVTVRAFHDGVPFAVRLVAQEPEYTRQTQLARDIGTPVCFFLSLGLASALFLMRPRPATLAFYLYAVLMLFKVYQTPLDLAAWPMNLAIELTLQIIYPLTQIAILLFAQRLYGRRGRAWPWIIWPAVGISVAVFFIWADPTIWITTQHFRIEGPQTRVLKSLADAVLLVFTLAGLAYIASGAQGVDRRRVPWIIGGIAIAPMLDLTWALNDTMSALVQDRSVLLLAVDDWTDALLPWAGLCGIVAVLYGFLSERVIDFRVAIGRAALYGGTTIFIVVIFGAIEWMAEQIFESTRPAMYASLIAALAIGFAMRAVHDRMEGFVDGVFFKELRRATEALKKAARALTNTTSERTLVEFLVDEPVTVLHLSSAALFIAREDGEPFERVAAHGFGASDAAAFDADDALAVVLRAELEPIRLDARRRAEYRFPAGGKPDALVLPLVMRGKVFGFVYYGEREDGAAFTAEELELLLQLATAAASAYDHIDADRSRRRIAELEARLGTFVLPGGSQPA